MRAHERIGAALRAVVARHGAKPGLSREIAAARIALMEAEMAPLYSAMETAGTPVACARGCGCCCTLTVDVSPDEVFALIDYLERTLDPEALADLKARARERDAAGHGLEPLTRHRKRLVCPVQDPETKACLGHPARPNPCQGYVSLALASCEADHANPPQRVLRPIMSGILTDLMTGTRNMVLAEAGAPIQSLELTAALVAAWASPDAEARWLAGENVLPEAKSYAESPPIIPDDRA
jgi:Fe-S-cluster containining protein